MSDQNRNYFIYKRLLSKVYDNFSFTHSYTAMQGAPHHEQLGVST